MLSPKVIGAIAGLTLGIVLICFGFWKALAVGVFVLAGWFVGKIWMGEIDLQDIYERFRSSRDKRPRE